MILNFSREEVCSLRLNNQFLNEKAAVTQIGYLYFQSFSRPILFRRLFDAKMMRTRTVTTIAIG
jgi:hypothetical protein